LDDPNRYMDCLLYRLQARLVYPVRSCDPTRFMQHNYAGGTIVFFIHKIRSAFYLIL